MNGSEPKRLPNQPDAFWGSGWFWRTGYRLQSAAGPGARHCGLAITSADTLAPALQMAYEATGSIVAQFGTALDHATRLRVSSRIRPSLRRVPEKTQAKRNFGKSRLFDRARVTDSQ
jgi:hypothetical protein